MKTVHLIQCLCNRGSRDRSTSGQRVFLALLLVVLCGCSGHRSQAGKWHNAPVDKETGRAVMLWLTYPDDFAHPEKMRPHVLENDYAMLILWGFGEKEHEFYFFDSKKHRYFYTEDPECFRHVLRQLPEGAVVEWVQKCAAPFYYGMPEEEHEKISQTLRERKTSAPEFQSTVCVCEATGLKFLEANRVLTRHRTE